MSWRRPRAFALRLHVSAAPPRVGLTQALARMTTIEVILLATTGNALVLAVLGWLARSLIQNLLSKDLDKYRLQLESENQRAAQAFGHELSLAAKEHDIRFGKLHERRAETIAMLYELLTTTSEKGSVYSSPHGYSSDPPKSEQYNDFANSYNQAAKYFYRNKLFLPAETCVRVEALFQGIKEHPSKMNMYMSMAEQHPGGDIELKKLDAWNDAWRYFQDVFKPAMAALEQDLRGCTGFCVNGVSLTRLHPLFELDRKAIQRCFPVADGHRPLLADVA